MVHKLAIGFRSWFEFSVKPRIGALHPFWRVLIYFAGYTLATALGVLGLLNLALQIILYALCIFLLILGEALEGDLNRVRFLLFNFWNAEINVRAKTIGKKFHTD